MKASVLVVLLLAGCASRPQMVMVNPRSGAIVDCEVPMIQASSADFLASRACLSACQAHGFRPVPGLQSPGSGSGTPSACMN